MPPYTSAYGGSTGNPLAEGPPFVISLTCKPPSEARERLVYQYCNIVQDARR